MKSLINKLRAKIYRELRKEYDYVYIQFWLDKKYQIQIGIDAYIKAGDYSRNPKTKNYKSGTHYITSGRGKTISKRINNLIANLNYYFDWNLEFNCL